MTAPERFDAVARLLPEPMVLVAADGTIVAANPAFASAAGRAASALVGLRFDEVAQTSPEPAAAYLRRCAGTRQLTLGAATIRAADGGERSYRSEGALFAPRSDASPAIVLLRLAPKETAAAGFITLTRRIGELSAEVARRRRAEIQLRDQREWLQVTLASIGDAVVATDVDGRVAFMNGVAGRLTGTPPAEAEGKPVDEVLRIADEETLERIANPAQRVIAANEPLPAAGHLVLLPRHGPARGIDVSGAPIRDAAGRLFGVVLVLRDVTDVRAVARQREAAREAAEDANRTKDEFLATLSHELRTPLNAILGWARMMASLTPVQQQRGLEVIERNAEAQARLVEDLLDVSRIATGKLQLRCEPVDFARLVQSTVASVEAAARNREIDLVVQVPRLPPVLGDPTRLQQILWNLLSNAIKFNTPGGRVELRVRADGPMLEAVVRDTGMGFDPHFRPFMFEAFRQADSSFTRRHGGLGLGLTIVRRLAEAHGGSIDAESPGVGEGAVFTLRLPFAPAGRVEAGRAAAQESPAQLAGVTLLVVDDDPDACELLEIQLRGRGATVATASSAAQALKLLSTGSFDAVLADIAMPEGDGYWLLERVRALGTPQARVPAIAVTAFAGARYRDAALRSGFDAYVAKPVDVDALLGALEAVLPGRVGSSPD